MYVTAASVLKAIFDALEVAFNHNFAHFGHYFGADFSRVSLKNLQL